MHGCNTINCQKDFQEWIRRAHLLNQQTRDRLESIVDVDVFPHSTRVLLCCGVLIFAGPEEKLDRFRREAFDILFPKRSSSTLSCLLNPSLQTSCGIRPLM
jgi:hypothetical protein